MTRTLTMAYLHYGVQSGLTGRVGAALAARGHLLYPRQVTGPLEWHGRDGRRRLTPEVALHLGWSALHFGRHALSHRWNTTYAFDAHSRHAGRLLAALPGPVDTVLQNGALYAPGRPAVRDYVLLLDHTRQLSMERPAFREEGLPAPADYGPGWRRREEAVYRGARAIATFSERVAASLQRDYGLPADRLHVVGAGANVLPAAVRRRDDGRTLVFVGKDFRRKGGPVLLRAFERLRRTRPDTRLLILGPGEPLLLPAGARQLGFVPLEQLADVLATATAFVLPTLREPFGLAFLDAMACGLPCIGTRVEAVPEIVREGETGLLVSPGDDAALALAMGQLLSEPARARAMGLAGRTRVEAQFTWDLVAARLERCLVARPVPNGPPGRPGALPDRPGGPPG